MKKESKIHISVVADNLVTALENCAKGSFFYKRNGESIMSIPMLYPKRVKKEIENQLAKLVKNIIKIENK